MAKRPAQPRPQTKSAPWYADGLRFECTQCGECCSGEPGYVFVDEHEIEALAQEMKLDRDAFEDKFLRRVGKQISLIEYPDGDCIFLDPKSRRCMVYNARPIQCRTWPFWDSTLADPTDWEETCQSCPGAGKGKLYHFDEIEIRRKEKSV
ncbi:MAG: YkgJ family cysteine cluster protein [Rhodopirellula sp. JB055]|uniref:YkgJ family cysteine cluster protein n=1 Tax=Rhodopirellula sp. JB055 TaxID=3342846 RepID=UPI00370B29CE